MEHPVKRWSGQGVWLAVFPWVGDQIALWGEVVGSVRAEGVDNRPIDEVGKDGDFLGSIKNSKATWRVTPDRACLVSGHGDTNNGRKHQASANSYGRDKQYPSPSKTHGGGEIGNLNCA